MSKDEAEGTKDAPKEQPFSLQTSRMFPEWLASTGCSIAFTTYQASKIFLIGSNADNGRLSVFERTFPRCMGFGVDTSDGSRSLWLSSLFQLWRFENFLAPGETKDGYDAIFVPMESKTTGDVDVHDIHAVNGKDPIFVVTRFNCLATTDEKHSFRPIWKPPFIDRIAAEDRCHLNGLAVRDGKPAYVTCVSDTNHLGGWREKRRDGGRILDIATGEPVITGLSMPHSPRWYRDTLYVLQTGTGEFGTVDMATGKFEPMCFLNGFARGVTFFEDYAIIGISRPRKDKTFEGLQLQERLQERGQEAECKIVVVNLKSGDIEHSAVIKGVVQELYDVAVLRSVRRAQLIGLRKPEIRFMVRPAKFEA